MLSRDVHTQTRLGLGLVQVYIFPSVYVCTHISIEVIWIPVHGCQSQSEQLRYLHALYVCMYVCMFVCMYVCLCIFVCMYICIYMYIYIYMYVCMYVWHGHCPSPGTCIVYMLRVYMLYRCMHVCMRIRISHTMKLTMPSIAHTVLNVTHIYTHTYAYTHKYRYNMHP